MSYVQDRPDPVPAPRPVDIISAALGADIFVRNHRFGTLYIQTPMGRSPRLTVSRYYWNVDPPVAVDFVKEVKRGEAEVEAKREYCAARGIHYILAVDEWDEDAIRGTTPVAESEDAPPTAPLVTAPRKKSRTPPAPPRAT